MAHPPKHCLNYGDPGAGKSTFAATWPKPMLLFSFDGFGKETPYVKRGVDAGVREDELGTPIRDIVSKRDGQLIIQIEYYLDADPQQPTAWTRFLHRMSRLQAEYDQWQTIVFDSVSSAELYNRKWHEYVLNPFAMYEKNKDMRQWWGGSTHDLEEMLWIRFGSLPMNVVVVAHVDEEKDDFHGTFVRSPSFPGRLRKKITAAYSELFRSFVAKGDKGERLYLLQTQADSLWNAMSSIPAPDPCWPAYDQLWSEAEK